MDVDGSIPLELAPGHDGLAGLLTVRRQLDDAARRCGREPDGVNLVAASKTVTTDRLDAFISAGLLVFGENRVQEAKDKWPQLRARHPDVVLHLIGPLQSNKAADAVALFDVIQSLDRESLAQALAKAFDKAGRQVPLLVQVNIGREPQKAGVLPENADRFVADCRRVYGFDMVGAMCIPPEGAPAGPYFTELAAIAKRNGLADISMGMSSDFELAIEHGATHVRVGSAIFGSRPRPAPDPTATGSGTA